MYAVKTAYPTRKSDVTFVSDKGLVRTDQGSGRVSCQNGTLLFNIL